MATSVIFHVRLLPFQNIYIHMTGQCDEGSDAGWTGAMCDKGCICIFSGHSFFFHYVCRLCYINVDIYIYIYV